MRPEIIEPVETSTASQIGKPRRGRPPGRRNKPKLAHALAIKPAAMPVKLAAAYIGVSVTTIRRLAEMGEIEKRYAGSALVIMTRSLDAYLERCSTSVATAIRKPSKREIAEHGV
jgi:hypothetical protein